MHLTLLTRTLKNAWDGKILYIINNHNLKNKKPLVQLFLYLSTNFFIIIFHILFEQYTSIYKKLHLLCTALAVCIVHTWMWNWKYRNKIYNKQVLTSQLLRTSLTIQNGNFGMLSLRFPDKEILFDLKWRTINSTISFSSEDNTGAWLYFIMIPE